MSGVGGSIMTMRCDWLIVQVCVIKSLSQRQFSGLEVESDDLSLNILRGIAGTAIEEIGSVIEWSTLPPATMLA